MISCSVRGGNEAHGAGGNVLHFAQLFKIERVEDASSVLSACSLVDEFRIALAFLQYARAMTHRLNRRDASRVTWEGPPTALEGGRVRRIAYIHVHGDVWSQWTLPRKYVVVVPQ